MPVPSQVPTSFVPRASTVPHQDAARPRRFDFSKLFVFVAYGAFVLVVLGSIGLFVYEQVQQHQISGLDAQLATAEKGVDASTINGFLHLRDQLASVQTLLDSHVTLSRFFNLLEQTTVANVSFTSLKLNMQDNKTALLKAGGLASNFNALAAEAKSLTASGDVTNVSFSGLSVNQNGTVNFTLSASVAPALVENFNAIVTSAGTAAADTAASSAASSTPAVTTQSSPTATTSTP